MLRHAIKEVPNEDSSAYASNQHNELLDATIGDFANHDVNSSHFGNVAKSYGNSTSDNDDGDKEWEDSNLIKSDNQRERFVNSYKKIQKLEQMDQISQSPSQDPMLEYLKEVDRSKIPPHQIPFKSISSPRITFEESLNQTARKGLGLKSYYISDNFANAFSQNLRLNNGLTSLILCSTNLNDQSFAKLIENLPVKLKKLDISRNPNLTIKAYE